VRAGVHTGEVEFVDGNVRGLAVWTGLTIVKGMVGSRISAESEKVVSAIGPQARRTWHPRWVIWISGWVLGDSRAHAPYRAKSWSKPGSFGPAMKPSTGILAPVVALALRLSPWRSLAASRRGTCVATATT
jgi:hypothetical protein